MANKYLLDSSVWIEYFAGTETGRKAKEIIEKEKILTCILSIAEISDKFSREKEKFNAFLEFIKNASVIANITLASCSEAGNLKTERRTSKKEFSLADAIIYLTAKENSCVLVAKDNDFEGMQGVVILR
ncbi:MAG: PIN domain-containing protein [Candidatus Aenigmarchaeota archaeon]|nr:PIN domain-containing protein [Candidatus Aenigmarchaeota archaeon]MDI6722367.1 PIN domain-containing protein [Candidatus Aenigmarchaeota archaeon]